MHWFILFVLVLFLNLLTFNNGLSHELLPGSNNNDNNNNKRFQPAVVVGTVSCDTCFQQQHLSKLSHHFISGATVGVECRDEKNPKKSFRKEIKTNRNGKFKVVLPFSVSKHLKKIESCSVKLIKSNEPFCSVASSATSSVLKLKNSHFKNGLRIYSAGFFTFKPLQQPTFCTQNPDIFKSQLSNPQFLFPPIVPPVIQPPPSFLPPNPLQPAPLVPNPFQPPAPLIPNPFQPPPGSVIPLPPLPFLTPPPPPPTLLPPTLVPPFLPPLPTIPGIPSGPPREESSSPIKQSP